MSSMFNFRETCYWSVQMIVWAQKERWPKSGKKLALISDCLSILTSRFLLQDVTNQYGFFQYSCVMISVFTNCEIIWIQCLLFINCCNSESAVCTWMNVRTSSELWQCNYIIDGSPYSQRTDNIFILCQIFFIGTKSMAVFLHQSHHVWKGLNINKIYLTSCILH
jgi:hypothetical protein